MSRSQISQLQNKSNLQYKLRGILLKDPFSEIIKLPELK